MKIIIAGAGRGGLGLAIYLQSIGHNITVLERDSAVVRRATDEHGIVMLEGDSTDATLLLQADPARADAVVAMLHRDADNLSVALLARTLGAKRVMVRMRDPAYRAVYEGVGIRQILSETEILVGALATAIEHEAVQHSMVLGAGEAIAAELGIAAGARVVGRSVSEVAADPAFPKSAVIAGMTRHGAVQAPRGASVFEAGTQVLVVSAREDLAPTIEFFLRRREETDR